jgi:hypothetical protein
MRCPIDLRETKLPIKPKYLDEETPEFARWTIFGWYPHPDHPTTELGWANHATHVDIHDGFRGADIMLHVPREMAEKIIAARDKFADEILTILMPELAEKR